MPPPRTRPSVVGPRPGAQELERDAAARPEPPRAPAPPASEALAMLVRRGLAPSVARLDLPFPRDLDADAAERLAAWLDHYGHRLLLRGAILARGPFDPASAGRYLPAEHARRAAEELVALGLVLPVADGTYRLRTPARSFGGTLEWWVARELQRRLAIDAVAGVRSGAPGVGGDLDVVAAVEGHLLYVELKSSPPKHLTDAELAAFVRRVRALRPHLAVFAMDTALRLADKVLPMLAAAFALPAPPRRLRQGVWALAPNLHAVSARPDLLDNLVVAIADGLRAAAPEPP